MPENSTKTPNSWDSSQESFPSMMKAPSTQAINHHVDISLHHLATPQILNPNRNRGGTHHLYNSLLCLKIDKVRVLHASTCRLAS